MRCITLKELSEGISKLTEKYPDYTVTSSGSKISKDGTSHVIYARDSNKHFIEFEIPCIFV